MSFLLTADEVEALEIKHKPQNGPGSFIAYSRAIQIALIEKLRKELPPTYIFPNQMNEQRLVCLPTPQELENE